MKTRIHRYHTKNKVEISFGKTLADQDEYSYQLISFYREIEAPISTDKSTPNTIEHVFVSLKTYGIKGTSHAQCHSTFPRLTPASINFFIPDYAIGFSNA